MPLKEKMTFLKKYSSLWAAWRHPIPSESFSQLKTAVKEKRLKFYQSIGSPEYYRNSFFVRTTEGGLMSNTLWDGTGGTPLLQETDSLLINNLLFKNYIEPHPCGGIMIDPKTFNICVKGENINGLYNIGPLNKGALFSTNAFWFNAQCSERWAHQWAKRIHHNTRAETEIIY